MNESIARIRGAFADLLNAIDDAADEGLLVGVLYARIEYLLCEFDRDTTQRRPEDPTYDPSHI